MQVFKLDSDHIASQLMTAIREAGEAGEFISSISLSDAEFKELLNNETVKNTQSKWYGSNEGGMVLTGIQTRRIGDENVPVVAYFNGIKIVRG